MARASPGGEGGTRIEDVVLFDDLLIAPHEFVHDMKRTDAGLGDPGVTSGIRIDGEQGDGTELAGQGTEEGFDGVAAGDRRGGERSVEDGIGRPGDGGEVAVLKAGEIGLGDGVKHSWSMGRGKAGGK